MVKEEPEEPEALVNFASLTEAELEASFGSFKPVHSLNPYMAKLDPCQAITIDQAIVISSIQELYTYFKMPCSTLW